METGLGIHFGVWGCFPNACQIKLHQWLTTRGHISAMHVLEIIKNLAVHSPDSSIELRSTVFLLCLLVTFKFFYTLIKLLLDSEELKSFAEE